MPENTPKNGIFEGYIQNKINNPKNRCVTQPTLRTKERYDAGHICREKGARCEAPDPMVKALGPRFEVRGELFEERKKPPDYIDERCGSGHQTGEKNPQFIRTGDF